MNSDEAVLAGYRRGIESLPRDFVEPHVAAAYEAGYTEGEEARRLIEEEAGVLIEKRVQQKLRSARRRYAPQTHDKRGVRIGFMDNDPMGWEQ